MTGLPQGEKRQRPRGSFKPAGLPGDVQHVHILTEPGEALVACGILPRCGMLPRFVEGPWPRSFISKCGKGSAKAPFAGALPRASVSSETSPVLARRVLPSFSWPAREIPPFRKRLQPGDTRGTNPQAKDDEEFVMSRSQNTIVSREPTKTVQTPPDDSQEQEERSADPRGERRRAELDTNRKKEGHEDRHDPGPETDRQAPIGTSVSFPEMFFG